MARSQRLLTVRFLADRFARGSDNRREADAGTCATGTANCKTAGIHFPLLRAVAKLDGLGERDHAHFGLVRARAVENDPACAALLLTAFPLAGVWRTVLRLLLLSGFLLSCCAFERSRLRRRSFAARLRRGIVRFVRVP